MAEKGNPDNPTGFKTAYLWEEVWGRDCWLDILSRFVHLEVAEEVKNGKKVRKETLIFPRYHQLDVVRKLLAASKTDGPGTNYLVPAFSRFGQEQLHRLVDPQARQSPRRRRQSDL